MSKLLNHPICEFFDLKNEVLTSDSTHHDLLLKSYIWTSDRCRKIRFCKFEVKDKFYTESLVIYPEFHYETPIFGTEYIKFGSKRYFGAIDFHPITDNIQYLKYLEMFPDKKLIKPKFYDLNKFFSEKLWVRKRATDFYTEYQIMLKCFLYQYKKCLYSMNESQYSFENNQEKYNIHMATNDPAYGILKSYFDKDFAENYIHNFLFSNK